MGHPVGLGSEHGITDFFDIVNFVNVPIHINSVVRCGALLWSNKMSVVGSLTLQLLLYSMNFNSKLSVTMYKYRLIYLMVRKLNSWATCYLTWNIIGNMAYSMTWNIFLKGLTKKLHGIWALKNFSGHDLILTWQIHKQRPVHIWVAEEKIYFNKKKQELCWGKNR